MVVGEEGREGSGRQCLSSQLEGGEEEVAPFPTPGWAHACLPCQEGSACLFSSTRPPPRCVKK